jgi:UDP-glucose 4-epimerase
LAPARVGDIRHSLADISAAKQAFGYEVNKRWTEGLAETLEFYRQLQDPPAA